MSNVFTDGLRALADAFSVPLILASGLVILAMLLRLGSSLRFFVQHRGRRPLVISVEYGNSLLTGGEDYGVLDARLLSYLAADGLGSYVIAPGAGGSAAPAVPAEALQPSAAIVRLAFPKEPAFRVDVTWPGPVIRDVSLRATVRISRTPGDRIVATRSFMEDTMDTLIEVIGCFCVTFLLNQPRIFRNTPRWERWSQDIDGYWAYRRGLEHEHSAEISFSPDQYVNALAYFNQAARIDPANMLVQLHRASLLELANDHQQAVAIYKKCRMLWPEHIEVAYRLGNAHKSSSSQVELAELLKPLKDIRKWLSIGRLLRSWLRTWLPNHWNPGERRYWRSWMSLRPWDRITKRSAYLHAVAISDLLARLSFVIPERNGNRAGADARRKENVVGLMTDLAAEILRRDEAPAIERLLRPETLAAVSVSVSDKASVANSLRTLDPAYIPAYGGPHYRRRNVGWLATFNAACFFSLAIWIPEDILPEGFTPEEWRECCARASIHELGLIHRDPRHGLDPNWIATDPDLEPLRATEVGRLWQAFVGRLQPEDE